MPDSDRHDTDADAARLLSGLEQQRRIYEALLRLTQEQIEVFAAGNTEAIHQLATAKESEMGRIVAIDAEIRELKSTWRDWREDVETLLAERVKGEIGRLSQVLEQLLELEAESERRFKQGQQERAEQLRRLGGSRKIQQAYGTGNSSSKLVDRSH